MLSSLLWKQKMLRGNDLLYGYYSVPRPKTQDGGMLIYRSGWRPYRNKNQQGGSFLSTIKGWFEKAKNYFKPVASNVGKKLINIGVGTLKDWAQEKNLNEAIKDNLHQAGIDAVGDIKQHLEKQQILSDAEAVAAAGRTIAQSQQAGTGRRFKRHHNIIQSAIPSKKPCHKHDCFDVL